MLEQAETSIIPKCIGQIHQVRLKIYFTTQVHQLTHSMVDLLMMNIHGIILGCLIWISKLSTTWQLLALMILVIYPSKIWQWEVIGLEIWPSKIWMNLCLTKLSQPIIIEVYIQVLISWFLPKLKIYKIDLQP